MIPAATIYGAADAATAILMAAAAIPVSPEQAQAAPDNATQASRLGGAAT
jgi:hypothetical protein